jgi:hypothetical protein
MADSGALSDRKTRRNLSLLIDGSSHVMATRTLARVLCAFLVALTGALTAASCGTTESHDGTNTNWVHCSKDADCASVGNAAVCQGGLCMAPNDGGRTTSDGGTVACNDGTGGTDCCPDGVKSGAACTEPDLRCWSRCSQGYRMQYACSGGTWLAGHGLFPCNVTTEDAGGPWPACKWPATLGAPDASARTTCDAARTLLSCTIAGGGSAGCISNDPTTCAGVPGVQNCTPQCGVHEYVAACGGVGPGPVPDPPTGCRAMGAVPAGIAYYCCPCISGLQ